MDVVIVCHTEFGYVKNRDVIYDKIAVAGVSNGALQLIKIADKYKAKVSFAVCPETVPHFPKHISHEIGLHVHPGWQEFSFKDIQFFVGDAFLREHCRQSVNSTVLRDFSYEEQLGMIHAGKEYLKQELYINPSIFVAGRWSLNNDTVKALVVSGFTHDLSAPSHSISDHYDWSKTPRICLPYHPDKDDYQKEGDIPLLMVPVSQTLFGGTVNPEGVITYGLPWLMSCIDEYHRLGVPLFHICLHSPSMTDNYYQEIMEKILKKLSSLKETRFLFASEIKEYQDRQFKGSFLPYLSGINGQLMRTALQRLL